VGFSREPESSLCGFSVGDSRTLPRSSLGSRGLRAARLRAGSARRRPFGCRADEARWQACFRNGTFRRCLALKTNPILLGEPQCLLWFSGCATACPRWIPREPSVLIHSRRFGVYLTIGPSVAWSHGCCPAHAHLRCALRPLLVAARSRKSSLSLAVPSARR
jgi:hypothetical protein